MKQQEFFKKNPSPSHGGSHRKGRRKTTRPLSKNHMLHVVMRSQHAVEQRSFKSFHLKPRIESLIYDKASKYGVRIAELSNVGNHFHLLIRFNNRRYLKIFFKVVLGLVARITVGAQRGRKFGLFWDGLVFTRVVSKGFDQAQMHDYLEANRIESELGQEARKKFLKDKAKWWRSRKKPKP